MSIRYIKTESGREALRNRAVVLSRPARNLLLIIDGSRTGDEWLTLVANTTAADLQALLDSGYVAAVAAPVAAALGGLPALTVEIELPLEETDFEVALQPLKYSELHARLTAEVRARLGLIKGYRMVLEIERCPDAEALRRLALRFADEVRATQGLAAAEDFRRKLSTPPAPDATGD